MGKEKLTNKQKLTQRKFKLTNKFYYWLYYFLDKLFIIKKYRPHIEIVDDINLCKGPCFLIFNHLSRVDHAYCITAAYPRRINIVAGYNEFFRSHLHTVFKLNNVIPKKIYSNDMISIKGMKSIIKQNGCICLAPEGMSSIYGTNQPIIPGTGHLFKHHNIPVYFLELRGQYLTTTKMCLDERYANTYASLKLMFTPSDLEKLTAQEIEDKINLAFKHDEYDWQKANPQKWVNKGGMTTNLDTLCYKCPKCGKELTMRVDGTKIWCEACGNEATVNDYYEFVPSNGSYFPYTPSKWVEWERVETIKEIRNNPNYSFTEEVKLGNIPDYKWLKDKKTTEICGEGTLTVDHSGVHYKGTKDGEEFNFSFDYKTVYSPAIVTDTTHFGWYLDGEWYEFYPKRPGANGKILVSVEELHRLHVNTWKNFPWNSWMYEDSNNN